MMVLYNCRRTRRAGGSANARARLAAPRAVLQRSFILENQLRVRRESLRYGGGGKAKTKEISDAQICRFVCSLDATAFDVYTVFIRSAALNYPHSSQRRSFVNAHASTAELVQNKSRWLSLPPASHLPNMPLHTNHGRGLCQTRVIARPHVVAIVADAHVTSVRRRGQTTSRNPQRGKAASWRHRRERDGGHSSTASHECLDEDPIDEHADGQLAH